MENGRASFPVGEAGSFHFSRTRAFLAQSGGGSTVRLADTRSRGKMSYLNIFASLVRSRRNPVLRPIGIVVSGGFAILIFSLAALAGILFDQVLTADHTGVNVREFISSHSLIFILVFYLLRLLVPEDSEVRLKPYLLLPVSRDFLVLASMFSRLWNIPILIFAPFACFVVCFHFFPGESPLLPRLTYAAGSLLLLTALDWLAQWTREATTARPWLWSLTALLAGAVLIPRDVNAGRILAGVSTTLFCPDSPVTAVFPAVSLFLACGIGAVQFLQFRSSLYLDHRQPSSPKGRRLRSWIADAGSRPHRRMERTFLIYEWRLIWRQKRTRQLILLTTPASWIIGAFFLSQPRGGSWHLILASFASLLLANTYGVRLFGWEGRHFSGLLAWPQHDRPYLRAKITLLRSMILLSSPPLVFGVVALENRLLTASLLFCFWSACPHLFVIAGLWNQQYMSTSRGALANYQGVDLLDSGSLPLLAFLALQALMTMFLKTQWQSWINLSLSAALLAAEDRVSGLLARYYDRRKYSLFQAYRLENRNAD